MKSIYLLMFVLIGFSCNSQTSNKQKIKSDLKDAKLIPDSTVALNFINAYADHCSPGSKSSHDTNWIEKNPLLTDNFKTTYENILDSAKKADPEMGLDFDPIFNAQDFPDKGFEIVKCDKKTGYVTVRGKDWKNFILVIRIVNFDNKWLVDGSGIINIPKNKQAKIE